MHVSGARTLKASRPPLGATRETVYTEREVSGLVQNDMRRSFPVDTIAAYTEFIQSFARQGLFQRLQGQAIDGQSSKISPEHSVERCLRLVSL